LTLTITVAYIAFTALFYRQVYEDTAQLRDRALIGSAIDQQHCFGLGNYSHFLR